MTLELTLLLAVGPSLSLALWCIRKAWDMRFDD